MVPIITGERGLRSQEGIWFTYTVVRQDQYAPSR
jgi:hypothetical protein